VKSLSCKIKKKNFFEVTKAKNGPTLRSAQFILERFGTKYKLSKGRNLIITLKKRLLNPSGVE